jgi:hypothetical protein
MICQNASRGSVILKSLRIWGVFVAVPILQSLLLADHVYRDQATGKHIICGVFSTIFFTPTPVRDPASAGQNGDLSAGGNGSGAAGANGPSEPTEDRKSGGEPGAAVPFSMKQQPIQSLIQAGSPYVYFSVTELRGRKTFEVRYVDLHENRPLFQAEVPIECDDPLKTIEVALPLPRLPLVAWEERSYALEVICEGQLLGSHRVLARINPAPPVSPPLPPPVE